MALLQHFGRDEARTVDRRLRVESQLLEIIFLVFDERDGLESNRPTRVSPHVFFSCDILLDLRDDKLAVLHHEVADDLRGKHLIRLSTIFFKYIYRLVVFAVREYPDEGAQSVENATVLVAPAQKHLRDRRQSIFLKNALVNLVSKASNLKLTWKAASLVSL